jgi:putative transposase
LVSNYPERDDEVRDRWAVGEPSRDVTEVSETEWADARRRLAVIRPLAENRSRTRADMVAAAAALGCGLTQAYVMLDRYLSEPTATSLIPRRRGQCRGSSRLARDLDLLIDKAIESMYLSKQRVRIADLVDEVRLRCHDAGIPPPSRKAITARVNAKPTPVVVARREGSRAARHRFQPVLGSFGSPTPLALVQIDHTLVDVIVVDSVMRAPIQRPWLSVAIDVHTRCVTGFHLSLEAPSATSVALCLAHAALPKEQWLAQRHIDAFWPIQGLPRTLHLDNGKEFHSEALRRGCEQYGISVEYRPVRTPHYGGHIERLIGTLMGKVHLLPGTTFSSIKEKGDRDPDQSATMTIDEVEAWLGHAIAGVYHRELHRTIGTTPLAAWERAATLHPAAVAVADPRRLIIDFLPMVRRQVRRDGVMLHSIAYWSDVLRTWVGEPEPMIVRYDPRDLSRIFLLGPDGNYYDLSYRDIRRAPISHWEHRRAVKRLREEGYSAVDEGAIFRTVERMRAVTDAANAATKGIRRERERRLRVATGNVHPALSAVVTATAVHVSEESPELYPVEEW